MRDGEKRGDGGKDHQLSPVPPSLHWLLSQSVEQGSRSCLLPDVGHPAGAGNVSSGRVLCLEVFKAGCTKNCFPGKEVCVDLIYRL